MNIPSNPLLGNRDSDIDVDGANVRLTDQAIEALAALLVDVAMSADQVEAAA